MSSGPGDILQLIRSGRARTRSEVREATGFTRVTVSQRLAPLLEHGLLRETEPQNSTGGRRPLGLEFNTGHSGVLVATLETTRTRTALTDLSGRILHEEDLPVSVQDGPQATLDAISESCTGLLAKAGMPAGFASGLGISLPGPVDPTTGRPSEPPIMPGWDAYPVAEHLSGKLDLPVAVDNDANAMALGEQSVHYSTSPSVVLIKVSTGIGCGVVIDGRVYQGVDGGAGDIGHIRLKDHPDALCRCGSHGCLAAVASGGAIANALASLGFPATSGDDVRDLLAAGNADAARLTLESGREIGEVAATIVSLVNPAVLLLAGDLASTSLLSGVRETLYQHALPRATRHLDIGLAQLGAGSAVIGMARTVVDQVFAPSAVNARFG